MKCLARLLLLLLLYLPRASAQAEPAQGDRELELWTGGGPGVNGGVGGIGSWNVGLRYGWIRTGLHGPGIMRGQFEYAVDVVPVFWVFEPKRTAYGFVLDPIALQWDFRERRQFIPYFEISGGPVFPGGKFHCSAELRDTHISDAGLTNLNPGVNTMQVRPGLGVFRHRKERQP